MPYQVSRAGRAMTQAPAHQQAGTRHSVGHFRPARRCTPLATASAAASTPFPWDVDALLRRCSRPEPLPMGGLILRNVLTESEQLWLYEALYAMPKEDSEELQGLRATATTHGMKQHNPDNRPQPFVTWVHPYTRLSNAGKKPRQLLHWADSLMHALVEDSRGHVVDSMLAQLYAGGGSLLKHCDEDLSWGIGVSLGSTAIFDCLPVANGERSQQVHIHSGDVLVGEFGLMPHAVKVTEEAPPKWWASIDSFGNKRRCNVLFRQALSKQQQRRLAEQRSLAIYGMPLAELRAQTGKDDAFLSVHLRHVAKE